MHNQFDAYAEYYNLFYSKKKYGEESNYVNELIRKNRSNSVEILEFGCGSGGHAYQLVDHGYSIHGVDISPSMLEQAQLAIRGDSPNLSFSLGDVRTLLLDREFDVVLSLFHVIGYQNTNQDLVKTFFSAYRHLKPGGLFIYDFWYGPTVLAEGPSNRVLKINDLNCEVIRISQPNMDIKNNLCHVDYSIFVKTENELYKKITEHHSMRYFFQNEFPEFEKNMFECLGEFSWLSKDPLKLGDWYGVRVCRKI